MDFVTYADESYIVDRYRSIATFSLLAASLSEVNIHLRALLNESNVSEFKWQKLKEAKYRFCAQKLVDAVFSFITQHKARIDVLIWDTHDSRHSVPNRDDTANFERMFFHLHSGALRRRPKNAEWGIYPDERLGIDWTTIAQCLKASGKHREFIDMPLFGSFFPDPHYKIVEFHQVKSHEHPCCQVADLFAGLAVFSKTHYGAFRKWADKDTPTLELFNDEKVKVSNSEEDRFRILKYFNSGCKQRKLYVSLKTFSCLYTYNPEYPLNFWPYQPQHEMDKAPRKI
jgi:hypothetical protein